MGFKRDMTYVVKAARLVRDARLALERVQGYVDDKGDFLQGIEDLAVEIEEMEPHLEEFWENEYEK